MKQIVFDDAECEVIHISDLLRKLYDEKKILVIVNQIGVKRVYLIKYDKNNKNFLIMDLYCCEDFTIRYRSLQQINEEFPTYVFYMFDSQMEFYTEVINKKWGWGK